MGIPGGEKKMEWTEEISEERITKNFPNFMVDRNPQVQEIQRETKQNKKYNKSFHIQSAKNKRENLKSNQRIKHITCR